MIQLFFKEAGMQPDKWMTELPASDTGNTFALLQHEISRTKARLEHHGESPALRERLVRLEALLEICLTPHISEPPI